MINNFCFDQVPMSMHCQSIKSQFFKWPTDEWVQKLNDYFKYNWYGLLRSLLFANCSFIIGFVNHAHTHFPICRFIRGWLVGCCFCCYWRCCVVFLLLLLCFLSFFSSNSIWICVDYSGSNKYQQIDFQIRANFIHIYQMISG